MPDAKVCLLQGMGRRPLCSWQVRPAQAPITGSILWREGSVPVLGTLAVAHHLQRPGNGPGCVEGFLRTTQLVPREALITCAVNCRHGKTVNRFSLSHGVDKKPSTWKVPRERAHPLAQGHRDSNPSLDLLLPQVSRDSCVSTSIRLQEPKDTGFGPNQASLLCKRVYESWGWGIWSTLEVSVDCFSVLGLFAQIETVAMSCCDAHFVTYFNDLSRYWNASLPR